tara:strand:- start:564 stop:884 length:321 start_codon:yes stop_codon:yes gene_type:complete
LKIPHRKEYEPLYRECWLKQIKQDKTDNPRLETRNRYMENGAKSKENGKLGGRPRKEPVNNLPLTKDAEVLNRMLQRKMTVTDAADIMGKSKKWAFNMKKKYDLPR